MKLFSYSPYDDTGGLGWCLADAWHQQRPQDEYRQVCGAPSYLNYPQHDAWNWDSIQRWWRDADAVHVHDGFHNIPKTRSNMVVTWHGTGFRESSTELLKDQRRFGATGMVSTLDLWLLAPDEVTWEPAPHDLDYYAQLRADTPKIPGPLRIGHSPTNRALKSTAEFLIACDRIKDEGADIEVVMIEGVSWLESVALKATCDVFFDQTAHGYAGSSIEAMGMGIPLASGGPDHVLAEFERRFGYIPFIVCTPATIYDGLVALMDPDVRDRQTQLGLQHADTYHSYRAVVELLAPIYAGDHA